MRRTTLALLTAPVVLAFGLAGCSGDSAGDGGDLTVVASFYPLQFVAEQVGGDHVTVSNLTPPAAEPHDLELAPATVDKLSRADLVVYESGFQAAVDDAVDQTSPKHVVDATDYADLQEHPNGKDAADDHADEADDHDHADEADDHDHEHEMAVDPHFWLDPTRLEKVATAVADQLSEADPGHADDYAANAKKLSDELTALDKEYKNGLAGCAGATLVTSHEAFGYLAERYDLDQVGISGIDPEAEPSPARLREVEKTIRDNDVKTLYTEQLLSPKVTEVLAKDVGVDTAVLDPLEGLSAGATDYLSVMRTNLKALETGLVCQ